MRFKFCGDLDCPDWVLAEIYTLSRVTSIKMKMLCNEVVTDILGKSMNYEKIFKITSDAKYDVGDVKATLAALCFILTSAAKHSVTEETLSSELQQLGLPKEHTSSLCKVYADKSSELHAELKKQSLKLTKLEDVSWRVDYILGTSKVPVVNMPTAQICLKIKEVGSDTPKTEAFSVTADQLRVLLHELKQAYNLMENAV